MPGDTVNLRYERGEHVFFLRVPPWIRNPTVMPRRDDSDVIEIAITKRSSRGEKWLINGVSGKDDTIAVWCLLCEDPKVVSEADVEMTVTVPLATFAYFAVRPVK
jgi:hypothetical protein